MEFSERIRRCRERARPYLIAQRRETANRCYWLHSPTHRPETHPDHVLYGTWAGTLASVLLGLDQEFAPSMRQKIVNAMERFQLDSGFFTMPGVGLAERGGHDDEYFMLHCTNYTVGALSALGSVPQLPEKYLERLAAPERLVTWLDGRNWNKPWTEGNNVVNLASLYAVLAERGLHWARERLHDMADWHDRRQNPQTGFWHTSSARSRKELFVALAGAAHNLHVYYYLERDVPDPERIVDSCLRLGYRGIRQACADIDVVDILVHMRRFGYRRREIDAVLKRYLCELLQIQNRDGGFSDNYVTPHRLYGHTTPARISVTWATWFRLVTIGMIACVLEPAERERWTFRNTLGMGYCNLRYALADELRAGRSIRERDLTPSVEAWLTVKRAFRFRRQRATWFARQWFQFATK